MENPFIKYVISQDDVLIEPELSIELKTFKEDLEAITLGVTENLAQEGLLERVISGTSSFFLRQDIRDIYECDFISFEDAMEQIAHAMITGFAKAVDNLEKINLCASVTVNLVIPEYTPKQAEFTLSVASKSKNHE